MSTKKSFSSVSSSYNLRGTSEKSTRQASDEDLLDAPFSSPKTKLNHAGVQAAISRLSVSEASGPTSSIGQPIIPPVSQGGIPNAPSKATRNYEAEVQATGVRVKIHDRKFEEISEKMAVSNETQTRFNDAVMTKMDANTDLLQQVLSSLKEVTGTVNELGTRIDTLEKENAKLTLDAGKAPSTAGNYVAPLSPFEDNDDEIEEVEDGANSDRFYAVWKGRFGHQIYFDWPSCEGAVKGFSGARYQRFATQEQAEEFIYTVEAHAAKAKAENKAKIPRQPLKVEIKGKGGKGTYPYSSFERDDDDPDDNVSGVSSTTFSTATSKAPKSRHSAPGSLKSAEIKASHMHEIREVRFFSYYQLQDNIPVLILPTMDTAVSLAESPTGFMINLPTQKLYYVVPPPQSTKERKALQGKPIDVRASNPSSEELLGGYVKPSDDLRDPSHLFPSSWTEIDKYFRLIQRSFQDRFSAQLERAASELDRKALVHQRDVVNQQVDYFQNYVYSLIDLYILSGQYSPLRVISWAHILLFVHNMMNRFIAHDLAPKYLTTLTYADDFMVSYKPKITDQVNHSVANLRVCLRFLQCFCPFCGSSGATTEVCFEVDCGKREAARLRNNEAAAAPLKAWNEAHNRAKGSAGYSLEAYLKAHPKPVTTGKIEARRTAEEMVKLQHTLTLRPVLSTFRSDKLY